MKNIKQLQQDVLMWASDRDITTYGKPMGQAQKLVEEACETLVAVCNGDHQEAVDGIGDTMVVLIILAQMINEPLEHCLEVAYNQIKDRKGKLNPNGIFVKQPE